MGLFWQVFWGTGMLVACGLLHVGMIGASVPMTGRIAQRFAARSHTLQLSAILGFALFVLVIAHGIQIWIWAVALLWMEALPDISTTVYFATVTYTTLGYGDVTVDDPLRIFATFASVTGLLTVGMSTAYLIAMLVRLMPDVFAPGP